MGETILIIVTWFTAIAFDRYYTKWKAKKTEEKTFPFKYTCQEKGCVFVYKTNHLDGLMEQIRVHEERHHG